MTSYPSQRKFPYSPFPILPAPFSHIPFLIVPQQIEDRACVRRWSLGQKPAPIEYLHFSRCDLRPAVLWLKPCLVNVNQLRIKSIFHFFYANLRLWKAAKKLLHFLTDERGLTINRYMHSRDVTAWTFIIDGLKINSNSVVSNNDKEFLVKEELKSVFHLPTAVHDIPRKSFLVWWESRNLNWRELLRCHQLQVTLSFLSLCLKNRGILYVHWNSAFIAVRLFFWNRNRFISTAIQSKP